MKIKVGLDIGGSTTKIVGMRKGSVVAKELVKAADPVTSAYGAVGKLINDNSWSVSDIEQINITGVGASFSASPILGIRTVNVTEFLATGLGGLYLSGLDRAVVVSMGTGTAYLDASHDEVRHVIGSGIGGGTLVGLCRAALEIDDALMLSDLARNGEVTNVDLTIGDLTQSVISGLPMNVTASNFGKAANAISREDIAAGIFNLVYQSIGTMSVLASKVCGLKDIVFTGQLSVLEQCKEFLMPFENLYGVRIIVPEDAVFATAVGSCVAEEEM